MKYCAVCLIAKDEEYYLKEWCEYHLRIGFDSIIIYDNGSKIPIKKFLKIYIDMGRVIVHEAPGKFEQEKVYTSCIHTYKKRYKWIAFIDSDEFLFPKQTDNIKIFLAEYECYGGVVANWVNFGTSGLLKRKDNSQIFNFILTDGAESSTIKSIVQPARVERYGVHGAIFSDGHYAVSTDHVPLHDDCYSSPFINDKIQINHYFFRSWEDYERKARRWIDLGIIKNATTFEEEQKKYTKPSFELMKFYVSIKNKQIQCTVENQEQMNISSVKNFAEMEAQMLKEKKLIDAELLCCNAALILEDMSMIYYFRAIISRITNNTQRALHYIYEALKLSGSSTIYYEYSRILETIGKHDKSKIVKKHADYKKYIEDTTCA
ncbi:glycosyltransferase family 2 protein [uncultured Desulfovibrio sp.]|uniref:glycosyltransferase family 2 protein n=1 Tax=uncultured Desulfovibrio sp. TaxID=167968 RepID=UPI00260808E4|nr:glycosyltransferase family 2 protein [uncultured Desulfovibrio sp.]